MVEETLMVDFRTIVAEDNNPSLILATPEEVDEEVGNFFKIILNFLTLTCQHLKSNKVPASCVERMGIMYGHATIGLTTTSNLLNTTILPQTIQNLRDLFLPCSPHLILHMI